MSLQLVDHPIYRHTVNKLLVTDALQQSACYAAVAACR
jgi:hypothetical protein